MKQIDDGFCPWLVERATFDSILQIPHLTFPEELVVPKNLIPFLKIAYSIDHEEFIHFYEHDAVFCEFLQSSDQYLNRFAPFAGVISPDCSL